MKIYRTSPDETQLRIAREAAEWGQVMRANPTDEERKAFLAWVEASPLHLREALLADCIDEALSSPRALADIDLDAVLASAAQDAKVVPLHPQAAPAARAPAKATRRRTGPRHWLQALAAMLVVAMGVSVWWFDLLAPAAVEYASAIGERRVLQLQDGSQVVLAPSSRISVAFSAMARDVDLVAGEADFQVAHDKERPFRVHAGASIIQAVGTRFSVNRLPSGTVVSVSEGKVRMLTSADLGLKGGLKAWLDGGAVEVRPPAPPRARPLAKGASLQAGQAVKISTTGRLVADVEFESTVDAAATLPRLTFHEDSLADIVAEFNRYNARQIVLDDGGIRWQRYSGVFNANDAESFLQFLECCSSLAVVREGDQTRLRQR